MSGLASRWIGYHALAFGIDALAGACIWSVAWHLGSPWEFVTGWSGWILAWVIRGFLVALAQPLALIGCGFPVGPLRWGVATWLGWGVAWGAAMQVMGVFIRATGPMIRAGTVDPSKSGYVMVGFTIVTGGVVFALAQGAAMFRRVPGRAILLWMPAVLGAWVVADLAVAVPTWLSRPGDYVPSFEVDLLSALQGMLVGGGQGSLFAAVLLPALRRLLALRPSSA